VRLIDHYGPDGWGGEPSTGLLPRQVVARDVVASILRDARGPRRVLDAGCGDGSFLEALAAHVADERITYVGLDYSDYQLAKAAGLPYEFHRCDLGDGIPAADASVDVLHAAEVIEHLYDPDLFVDECARVLRPGGRLVVSTPNLQAWFNRVLFLGGVQPLFYETSSRTTEVGAGALRRFKRTTRPVGHLRVFNRTALLDLLRRSGFTPVSVRGARYHDVPRSLTWLDAAFCARPSLASILVVDAVRS
jgi:2-polyprenyl-3-methyl-5-hydroxy-6-metoxy-1,4-benzoquinol methylase